MGKRLKLTGIYILVFILSFFIGYFIYSNKAPMASPFFISSASAFFGTFAAALMVWLIEYQRERLKFRRSCNLALARIYSNLYSLINFKRIHLLPLISEIEKVQKIYDEFILTFKNKDKGEAICASDFPKIKTEMLLAKIPAPRINRDISIENLVTDHVNFHQAAIIAEQASMVIAELVDLCEKWERMRDSYAQNGMSERAKAAVFFGAYPSSSGYEGSIKNLAKDILFHTEASLAFLDILGEKIREHAVETQGSKKQVLKIMLTDEFQKLMPSRELMKHWQDF